ncbi:uncharacterized protein C8R40DRAFT_1066548 [Lentinula edodes]|uniref:uncharacterized protein n=1 Tax=Lentinula edodes TaxID=5353 RepID=UPI001E8CF6EE|nr:uncharacterized protein C8R40DRAFT_1066548 [Lentinula edodes]KAH7879484.1 hypothetical protein C8R40DRAFT_1066548 [Lentinula edodes]
MLLKVLISFHSHCKILNYVINIDWHSLNEPLSVIGVTWWGSDWQRRAPSKSHSHLHHLPVHSTLLIVLSLLTTLFYLLVKNQVFASTVFFSGLATVINAVPSLSRRTDGLVEPASKWTLKVAIRNTHYWRKIKKMRASSDDIAVLIVGPDHTFAATTPGYDPATTPGTFIQPPVDDIPKATRGMSRLNGEYYMLLELETKFSFTRVELDEEAIFNTCHALTTTNQSQHHPTCFLTPPQDIRPPQDRTTGTTHLPRQDHG